MESILDVGKSWTIPQGVFAILLLVGGDVIHRALAQLVGGGPAAVSFSFGWVSYAFTSLLLAVGNRKLLPQPDCIGFVIPAATGYVRINQSWVIGRVIRDYDTWKDTRVDQAESAFLEKLKAEAAVKGQSPADGRIGLRISVYEATSKNGTSFDDWVSWSGFVVVPFQISLSLIPLIRYNNAAVFLATILGSLLSLLTSLIPQWRSEKWSCRRNSSKTVTLTRGNGYTDCIVVQGNGCGLDLEDLATGRSLVTPSTIIALGTLAAAWVSVLVFVAGCRDHAGHLILVAGVGMIHNVVVAGAPRSPSNFGIHLRFKEAIVHSKTMDALAIAEEKYPHLGRSLLSTFFPSSLRPREEQWWAYADKRAGAFDKSSEADRTAVALDLPSLRGVEKIPEG